MINKYFNPANLITIMLAAGTSITTTLIVLFFMKYPAASYEDTFSAHLSKDPSLPSNVSDMLNCGEGLYSPIQNKCVSRNQFNQEMKNLYSALGLNTDVFNQTDSTQNNSAESFAGNGKN